MNTSFEDAIRNYLNNEAEHDSAFAEKWEKRKREDDKAVEGCCSYIMAEAKKKAIKGCAVMTDAEVYGLAFHYIQEEIKAPEKKEPARVTTAPAPTLKTVPTPIQANVKKAEPEWPTLFNFDE